jgi:hypothetical protein
MCISNKRRLTSPSELELTQAQPQHLQVHHRYHDLSREAASNQGNIPSFAVTNSFPYKLYDMLERVEAEGLSHIVSWQPHGRCFVVHKPNEFKLLLPKFFTLSKVASFQRQLNLYGFLRLTKGLDKNGYYHERMLRGMPWLLENMQRHKVKGTLVRAKSNPAEEPNFYSMPPIGSPFPACVAEDPTVVSQSSCDEVVSQDESDDIVLNSWGQQFHFLDASEIPDKIVPEPLSLTSISHEEMELVFQSLDDLFFGGDDHDDIDFADLLEQVVL